MEEILLRFPHLSEEIFNLLDNKSLGKSKKVDRHWNVYIAKQKFISIRIIKITVGRFQKVGPEWNKLLSKSTTKTTTDLQKAVQLFYLEQKISQGRSKRTIFHNLNMPNGITPLHIAAFSGDLDLLKIILGENKNTKEMIGDVPNFTTQLTMDTWRHVKYLRKQLVETYMVRLPFMK